jgi:hypothetical protein
VKGVRRARKFPFSNFAKTGFHFGKVWVLFAVSAEINNIVATITLKK